MEKKRNSCRNGCEKFFKSIAATSPFRTIRPISHHPQDSMPVNPSPSASIPAVKTHPVAQVHLKTNKNKEAAEVVPIKFENSHLPYEKAKQYAKPHTPLNGQVAKVAPKVEAISQIAPIKTGKTKPKAEVTEQEDNVYRKGKIEPESHVRSFRQKLKLRAADKASPAQAVGHGRQGAKSNGKAQLSRMESNNLGENMEDRFTSYINRAKIKIRTTSSVGDGNKSSSSGQDDGKDQFSNYINRAKKKMLRTMTNFIGGRSDSMK